MQKKQTHRKQFLGKRDGSFVFNQKPYFHVITLFLLYIFTIAQVVGLLGQYRSYSFTVSEEREMGEKLLSIVRKEFKILDSPDITQYITNIGNEVLRETDSKLFDYHFFIVKDKEFNAFAAPSGLIFMHTGLIEVMDTENELVSVMAHEVAHVESRHYANRIKKSAKVNVATAVLILAGIALGGGPLGEALVTGSMAAGASMGLKFSRQDEEESDRLAFKWMRSQKRNPGDMVDMLGKIRKINLYRIDEFKFQRIKYRILSLTKPASQLIPFYLKRISTLDSNSNEKAMLHYGLSQAYLTNAEYSKAEQYLRKVLKVYQDKPILKADLGKVYFEAGRYKDGLRYFKEARSLDHENAYTAYYLAKTLEHTGDITAAVQIYEELLSILPDYSSLYYQLGKIKALRGDEGTGYYYLGVYYWYEGDEKMAKINLNKALTNEPSENFIHEKAKKMLEKIERLEKIKQ